MADQNQGEGDKISAEIYNKKTTEFAKSGRVDAAAQDAKKALAGKEHDDLVNAEAKGRSRARDEDPSFKR